MLGNNMDRLKDLDDNSVDSVLTDPPYGLKFMNKRWDYDVPSVDFWNEVYRVLKPGGHVLSFGGTRTYHRMVVNLEDAGFEIRDCISWIYGSGFPKSHNIGKNVDKIEGNERESLGTKKGAGSNKFTDGINGLKSEYIDTKGQSQWEGWGTALKPSQELICLARKPLSEKSIVENVVKWGTGGLNIDGCRIEGEYKGRKEKNLESDEDYFRSDLLKNRGEFEPHIQGRFPANTILECICDEVIKGEMGKIVKSKGRKRENHNYNSVGNFGSWDGGNSIDNYNDKGDVHTDPNCPCRIMDEQSGQSNSQSGISSTNISQKNANWYRSNKSDVEERWGFGDKGGASRFFYQSKVGKKERNLGLEDFEEKEKKYNQFNSENRIVGDKVIKNPIVSKAKNNHPTVKPINLLTYLVRLITPKGGVVLDPFMGSGSSGISTLIEGFQFIGMEMDEQYFEIASKRISKWEEYKSLIK